MKLLFCMDFGSTVLYVFVPAAHSVNIDRHVLIEVGVFFTLCSFWKLLEKT